MASIWRKGSAMSSRKTYLVRSDCMEMQFTRKTEEGARRQLDRCAEAAPDVQCDLYKLDERLGVWDWVSASMSCAFGD